jgi:TonB family protein
MRYLAAWGTFVIAFATQTLTAADESDKKAPQPRAVAVRAPRPEYPYAARARYITGSGVAVMRVDRATGKVTSCHMAQSTGSHILDRAAVSAFSQWHFKPGTVKEVRIPITFTVGGQVFTEYRVKEKPVDDTLAAFLGKGTVLKGQFPAYPRSVPWTEKQGSGVYELHVGRDGAVSHVKILKRSGDDVFDRTAVDTLRKWRLRRGPLILELPLAFRLSSSNYSVVIPKHR